MKKSTKITFLFIFASVLLLISSSEDKTPNDNNFDGIDRITNELKTSGNENVTVTSPTNNSVWNAWESEPPVNVSISDNRLDSVWYYATWYGGKSQNYTIPNATETPLNDTLWKNIPVGKAKLSFYYNISNGDIKWGENITIYKFGAFAINESAPFHNWSWYEDMPWGLGSGTVFNPYILFNEEINAQNESSCITIINSDAYFEIQGGVYYNASSDDRGAGITLINTTNVRSENCEIYDNQGDGIHLCNSTATIIKNSIRNNNYGIYLEGCNNTVLGMNNITGNRKDGISMINTSNTFLYHAIIHSNDGIGINISNGKDNIISGSHIEENVCWRDNGTDTTFRWNLCNDTGQPISIDESTTPSWVEFEEEVAWLEGDGSELKPYRIADFSVVANVSGGAIDISYSTDHVIIENITVTNLGTNDGDAGIVLDRTRRVIIADCNASRNGMNGVYLLESRNNIVANCTFHHNQRGIYIGEDSDNAELYGCDVKNNTENGIFLHWSDDTIVHNNTIMNGDNGVYVWQSNRVSIYDNRITNNQNSTTPFDSGLRLIDTSHCDVHDNTISDNDIGIGAELSSFTDIYENNITNNDERGIFIQSSSQTASIYQNNISNNGMYGIYINGNDNVIYHNNITSHGQYGISVWGDSNDLYLNYLKSNVGNAEDWGSENNWNATIIGNYWDDYSGDDLDDDGIGDTPYMINGTGGGSDELPIWWDGIDIPQPFTLSIEADDPDHDGAVNLTWTESENSVSYDVYQHHSPITEINGSLIQLETGITDLHLYVTDIDDGTHYFVAVGVNSGGTILSNDVMATFLNSPKSFTIDSSAGRPDTDGNFTLSWTESEHANNYTVHQATDPEFTENFTVLISQTEIRFIPVSIHVDGIFYYRAIAYNDHGQIESNNISVEIRHSPLPFELNTDADDPDEDGCFNLTWTASPFATHYVLYEDGDLIAAEINGTSHAITNRKSGNYTYHVVAMNQYGQIESDEIVVWVSIPEEATFFDMIIEFIIGIILAILSLFGLAMFLRRRKWKREMCKCKGESDCWCDVTRDST